MNLFADFFNLMNFLLPAVVQFNVPLISRIVHAYLCPTKIPTVKRTVQAALEVQVVVDRQAKVLARTALLQHASNS